jgi:hypothetical protein
VFEEINQDISIYEIGLNCHNIVGVRAATTS